MLASILPCPALPCLLTLALAVLHELLPRIVNATKAISSTQHTNSPLSFCTIASAKAVQFARAKASAYAPQKGLLECGAGLQTGKAPSGSNGILAGTAAAIVLLFAAMTIELPHLMS